MSAAKTGAQRQAALRSKGRQVAVVLRNPDAIAALDALAAECGGVTAAITRALVAAGAHRPDGRVAGVKAQQWGGRVIKSRIEA